MSVNEAIALVTPTSSIYLSELSYVCIRCWDFEYQYVQELMQKASLIFKRRPAISGTYLFFMY